MKFAVVTGSTKGIGLAIAADLLRRGCFVVLNYSTSEDAADQAKRELSQISNHFCIIKADLSCHEGLESFSSQLAKISKTIDYLILNVGLTQRVAFSDITRADWDTVIDANLTIPFFLIQNVAGAINDHGRIILIGSILGKLPHAISIPYSVSKAGLNMLAKCLVKEFSARSITVNVVSPGFTNTSWHASKDVAHLGRIIDKISLNRLAEPHEISSTCMHLIDNGYINGQVITVDGGYDYR